MNKLWVVIADGEHVRVVSPTAPHGQFATTFAFDSARLIRPPMIAAPTGPGGCTKAPARPGTPSPPGKTRTTRPSMISSGRWRARSAITPRQAISTGSSWWRPPTLHDLPAATAKIVGALEKDLTKTPNHDLTAHLAEWWRRSPETD